MRYAVTAAAIIGAAAASLPTTIDPCPAAPTPFAPITVTEQYQTLSFCVPTTTCDKNTCTTSFPLASTSVYVSTVIPCAVDGTSASSCTVTATDQEIPCSASSSTITHVTPMPFTYMDGNQTKTGTSFSTDYQTTSIGWSAPFNKLGPNAIPGYGGSGLCKDCGQDKDGNSNQFYHVDQCQADNDKPKSCHNYPFTHVSTKAPSSTSKASAVVSSKAAVDHPGTYTYTFPQAAKPTEFTVGNTVYKVGGQPWFAYATQTAHGPTTFDFTVTITHYITYYKPQPHTPPPSQQSQWQDWGKWQNSATTTPSKPSTTAPWNKWTPQPSSSKPYDPPKMTSTTSNQWEWGHWSSTTSGSTTKTPGTTSTISSTTSSWSGSPTEAPGPDDEQFYIKVVTNAHQRFRKRSDTKYVGFPGGDDGESVDSTGAAKFWFNKNDFLKTGVKYINNEGSGYIPFERIGSIPGGPKFTKSGGALTIPGGSFCVAGDAIIVKFKSSPSNCVPCELVCTDHLDDQTTTTTTTSSTTTTTWTTTTTTTTTMTTTTTTTSSEEPTTTTTTSDISADLDIPDPTPAPGHKVRRGIRGIRH